MDPSPMLLCVIFRESSGVVMEWGVVFEFTRVIINSYLTLQANFRRESF